MNKNSIKELKQKLETKKGKLENQLESFAKRGDKLKDDWETRFPEFNGGQLEEAADEVEEYSTMLPIEHALESMLRDINLALEKIEKGKYGICEKCGKKIAKERLMISLEARLCIKCEKKQT